MADCRSRLRGGAGGAAAAFARRVRHAHYGRDHADARADLADNHAYWKQWEGPVRETGEKVYTTFLQGYGQSLGMRSYGACVDLLVEEFLPNTTAGT